MNELLETVITMEILEDAYPRIKTLSREGFMAFLGCLIGRYSADHGFTAEETFSILSELSAIQKEVHDSLGMATSTVA